MHKPNVSNNVHMQNQRQASQTENNALLGVLNGNTESTHVCVCICCASDIVIDIGQ